MYALMLVLSLVATAAFLHVFAFGRGDTCRSSWCCFPRQCWPHNWGLFLALGLVCALVPCWYVSEVRSSFWKDALIGFGGAGILYLPGCRPPLSNCSTRARPGSAFSFGAPIQISRPPRRRDPNGGAGARRRLGARGDPPAPLGGQGTHRADREGVIVLATLAVAWLVSQVSPAWTTRYLGVLLGPML